LLVSVNELPKAFPDSFEYSKLKAFLDNTGIDLSKQLDVALPWIDVVSQVGGPVLLHCATGSS
jgi:protein-tyrosine phosphatase